MKRQRDGGARWFGLLVISVALGAVSSACLSRLPFRTQPELVFPRLDTANQQYFYAEDYERSTLVPSGKKGNERLRRIIACYQTVIDHFPNDDVWVPLALCQIGNSYFRMERYRKAIRVYEQAVSRYPNYPFVHAQAAWKIGQSYERLGRKDRAMDYYKGCIDTFRHSKNDQILAFVSLCRQYYLQPSVPSRKKIARPVMP